MSILIPHLHRRQDINIPRDLAYLETPDIVDLMRMDVAVGTHADQLIDIKWNNFLWIIDVAPRSGPLVKLRRLPIDILPAIVTTMFLVKVMPVRDVASTKARSSSMSIIFFLHDSFFSIPR